MGRLGGAEIILLALLGFVLFGAKRLPDSAKSIGEALHIFKKSLREGTDSPDTTALRPPVVSESFSPPSATAPSPPELEARSHG